MDYKVNFKELKAHVGIVDVAYSLGYRIDRKAGVGRYFEMVLGDGMQKRDTLVIRNTNDKANQTFFRRDGSKGDVITLIKENLNAFFVEGRDEWHRIAKVLSRFANMPEPQYKLKEEYIGKAEVSQNFDPSRYRVKNIDMAAIPALFAQRGLSADTVRTFAPFISLVQDKKNLRFDGFNVGFPYTQSGTVDVVGYEIRGLSGYKAKAAGTNSSEAAWVADLSGGNTHGVRSVFFCESAFDAMALYQMRGKTMDKDVAFVSLGGTFSDGQVKDVLKRFPNARAFDCFDNDIAGRTYAIRLLGLAENSPIKINKSEKSLTAEANGKIINIDPERPVINQMKEIMHLQGKMGNFSPPKDFKDWNDCLLGKRIEQTIIPNKNDRDRNLEERRNTGFKL